MDIWYMIYGNSWEYTGDDNQYLVLTCIDMLLIWTLSEGWHPICSVRRRDWENWNMRWILSNKHMWHIEWCCQRHVSEISEDLALMIAHHQHKSCPILQHVPSPKFTQNCPSDICDMAKHSGDPTDIHRLGLNWTREKINLQPTTMAGFVRSKGLYNVA